MTNAVHQADLFLSHDIQGYGQGWKTYKCALTVVDVASHFKEAEPLTLKDSTEVASSFQKNYLCVPLKWPQWLQVDPGREFMGTVTKEMKKQNQTFHMGALSSPVIRRSLKGLTAPLKGACLATNMPLKCGFLKANGPQFG